ncbi:MULTISPECIES: thiamine phosphate synthase [unclassified Beijerinckia]|uniref:thiamine phosphate synthase n=1 Tax=unclassified Beijerinckia TaxID=2638183 RepID=UPI00089B4182|nr:MULTISPECIES: thiamine phosphate synthase [unclassified Beijerinckia]MDH7798510.1 thiamine-phosphate pyrophosphorylase [Beijerinckia sp. GAS462]SED23292.1 thiamine-phosphate pyrophosphorylase [Beijerinckia sp. 28-YEA-48]
MSEPSEPTRLYLLTPRRPVAGALKPLLAAALAGEGIACVRIDDSGGDAANLRQAIAACQAAGAAALLSNPAAPGGADADGVHLEHPDNDDDQALFDLVRQARIAQGGADGQGGIVGAGGLRTRHQAMSAGELDVDYVMFGEPGADDDLPSADAVLERVRWWAEIFTVPCVAYARSLDDVKGLVEAGADFIALREVVWDDPRGPRAVIDDVLAMMAANTAAVS